MKIKVETLVKAPIDKVWSAYTTPADIVQWNTASPDWQTTKASVDLRVGGAFTSRIVPNELIEYTFGDRIGLVEFSTEGRALCCKLTAIPCVAKLQPARYTVG